MATPSFEVLTSQTSSGFSNDPRNILSSASLLTEGNSVVHCMLLTQLSINIDAADKRNMRWKGSVIYRDTHIDIYKVSCKEISFMHVSFHDPISQVFYSHRYYNFSTLLIFPINKYFNGDQIIFSAPSTTNNQPSQVPSSFTFPRK